MRNTTSEPATISTSRFPPCDIHTPYEVYQAAHFCPVRRTWEKLPPFLFFPKEAFHFWISPQKTVRERPHDFEVFQVRVIQHLRRQPTSGMSAAHPRPSSPQYRFRIDGGGRRAPDPMPRAAQQGHVGIMPTHNGLKLDEIPVLLDPEACVVRLGVVERMVVIVTWP